ncbi:MAG TPA: FAD-dependent oxidoreductase [Actinocrinis sp.]|nr:FAD-dependent oxidoreductase [Actinocrinis sp.]
MGVDVIVVGAGPTGLMLAHELASGGARVTVLEQATVRVQQTKGGAIQPRTAELLDARGLLDPLKDRMLTRPPVGGHFAGLPVELDCTPWRTRQPYPLSVAQWTIEEVFETAATALGAQVLRGRRVAAVEVDDVGVLVTADIAGTADTAQFRARYVVACDGAHSTARKALGLPFPGRPGTYRAVLADVRLSAVSDLVPASTGHMSTLTRSTRDYWGMLVPIGGDRYRFTYGKIGAPGAPGDATAPVSAEAVQHALEAVLIRPDGSVCWRAESGTPLEDALRSTFGAPAAAVAATGARVPAW